LSPDTSGTDYYTVNCYIKKTLTANDKYSMAEYWINFAYKIRYAIIPVTIISIIAAIVLFIFLMCSAGRKKGIDTIVPNVIDKIPFDIFLCILLTIVAAEF